VKYLFCFQSDRGNEVRPAKFGTKTHHNPATCFPLNTDHSCRYADDVLLHLSYLLFVSNCRRASASIDDVVKVQFHIRHLTYTDSALRQWGLHTKSGGSLVSTASVKGSNSDKDKFFLSKTAQTGSGAHPASYSVATGVNFRVVKWQGREADHSPLSNVEVKDSSRYTASPLYALVWTGRPSPCYNNGTYRHDLVCTVRCILFWFFYCHS
jgi:hypothetical protein